MKIASTSLIFLTKCRFIKLVQFRFTFLKLTTFAELAFSFLTGLDRQLVFACSILTPAFSWSGTLPVTGGKGQRTDTHLH